MPVTIRYFERDGAWHKRMRDRLELDILKPGEVEFETYFHFDPAKINFVTDVNPDDIFMFGDQVDDEAQREVIRKAKELDQIGYGVILLVTKEPAVPLAVFTKDEFRTGNEVVGAIEDLLPVA